MKMIHNFPNGTYWLDTGWGTGAVTIKNGRIIWRETAPIFRRLVGFGKNYKMIKLTTTEDKENIIE